MSRRILSDEKTIQLATMYSESSDYYDTAYLAVYFGVSRSTISKALHYAIENSMISLEIAQKIAEKAVRNSSRYMGCIGNKQSSDIFQFYIRLMQNGYEKKESSDKLEDFINELTQLQNHLESFDYVISSSDEFPYSKEDLENRIFCLTEKIKKLRRMLYL